MFKTLLRHTLRNFNRQRGYFLINVTGLAVSIACSIIIALFVIHHLSYDNYHEKEDRLYRIILNGKIGGQEVEVVSLAAIASPTMAEEFPEVESFLRMRASGREQVKNDSVDIMVSSIMQADSSFFNFFSIPLLQGDPVSILNTPYSMALSETQANIIFGDEDPIGKSLLLGSDPNHFTVKGVYQDIPKNTHFEANIITSFMTNPRSRETAWTSNSFSSYLLLKPNMTQEQVEAKFPDLIKKYVGPEIQQGFGWNMEEFLEQGNKYQYYLQPIREIHMDPSIEQEFQPASNPKYLYIFGSIALLIIVIACINYMNLSTAQATKRAREVGIKKLCGSNRSQLISQFTLESVFLTAVSLLIGVLLVKLIMPAFSNLIDLPLSLSLFTNWYTLPAIIALAIVIGLMAGTYPAFYLSHFKPIGILKGNMKSGMKNKWLRSTLVVFQFTISIMLISGTMVMYRQIQHIQKRDLGFTMENLLCLTGVGELGNQMNTFKEQIKQIPGVINATYATAIPGRNNNHNAYNIEGKDDAYLMYTSWTDADCWDTFEMDLVQGRGFDPAFSTDTFGCLVNEAAVESFHLDDPLNTRVLVGGSQGHEGRLQILGVVKNFHHESLHSPVQPYIFRFRTDEHQWGYLNIRLDPTQKKEILDQIETVWNSFTNNNPMSYIHLDDDFNRSYEEEKQSAIIAVVFTLLAILIASLGLFGLTSFTLAQRTREFGVRRTLGASVSNIFILVSKEISLLILISTAIALPVVWFVMTNWLQNFHYRISPGILDFLIGFAGALLIALFTISFKTLQSARENPAKALKYE